MKMRASTTGLLPAGPGDIPHLMLSEFASGFGNEWYVIPIDLDVGTLTKTRSLGHHRQLRRADVDRAGKRSAQACDRLVDVRVERRGAQRTPVLRPHSNLLFLAPSLLKTIDSRPLEEVLFMRDEMANMARAGREGCARPDRAAHRAGRRTRCAADDVADAQRVAAVSPRTDVPSNWTPLLPQRIDETSLRLVRASMLAPDGSNVARHAQGELLNAAAKLALFDEEIPREGVRVTRQFERTRWIGGSTLLWVGLRKEVGRGEGSSALRFDALVTGRVERRSRDDYAYSRHRVNAALNKVYGFTMEFGYPTNFYVEAKSGRLRSAGEDVALGQSRCAQGRSEAPQEQSQGCRKRSNEVS
jgi:hypothetical protein